MKPRTRSLFLTTALAFALTGAAGANDPARATRYGLGRTATPAEIAQISEKISFTGMPM